MTKENNWENKGVGIEWETLSGGNLSEIKQAAGASDGVSSSQECPNNKSPQCYDMRSQLLGLCSPVNFMNPYDPNKVASAKELYDKLKRTMDSDISELSDIRKSAELHLGVKVNVEKFYMYLMMVFSPKDYIDGDAKEFNRRNQICAKLILMKDNIDELENIQKFADEQQKESERQQIIEQREKEKELAYWSSLLY